MSHRSPPVDRRSEGAVGESRRLHVERLEDRRMLAGRAAEAVNAFALDVYEQMQREQGNLFFSPLSIATGLAMAYAGAVGETASEMERVLHLGEEPGIHGAFRDLLASLEDKAAPTGAPDLYMANAMWPQTGLPVNAGFVETIGADYEGYLQTLDYSNPNAAKEVINNWVRNETAGKIPKLVSSVTPATAMVLTNAIYYKGLWEFPFDTRSTTSGTFTRADGTTVTTPMMLTFLNGWSNKGFRSTTIGGYNIVDLPFTEGPLKADYSMVLIVPSQTVTTSLLPGLFSQLDAWLANPVGPSYQELELKLPKFKTEVSTQLNSLLIGLGMPTAFDLESADFSAMTPAAAAITRVFHKAVIEVNEQGTEAAAATEVQFAICFGKGTLVLTEEGEKPIDQLKVGDLVMARDDNNVEGALLPQAVEKVHQSRAEILELHVGGKVVRTTATHPFFVQGSGWTPAEELRAGDKLSTSLGDWQAVEKVVATQKSEPVYNLRVANYRTYFVGGKSWGFALWAHNSCVGRLTVDRPFHFLIRDNTTSTIMFMGRINDPLQLQNEVTPIFVAPSANFDGNATVDGSDFLAWQRGFGKMTGATSSQGDSNRDGDVDADDLAQWLTTFGQGAALETTSVAAAESQLTSAGGATNREDLVNAGMAWVQSLDEGDVNVLSSPFDQYERFHTLPPTIYFAVEQEPALGVAVTSPTRSRTGGFAGEDPDGWRDLVDGLLTNALE